MATKKFSGFTLSEVLLVLSVIGVVAAMTIPTLIQKIGDSQSKAGYKKAFSVASQALNMGVKDGNSFAIYSERWNALKTNMNILKTCSSSALGNCLTTSGISGEGNANFNTYFSTAQQNAVDVFVTADGMIWLKEPNNVGTNETFLIMVDVNGQGSPNKVGSDAFTMYINSTGRLSPAPTYDNTGNSLAYLYN